METSPNPFRQTEQQYARLRAQLSAGQINMTQFHEAIAALRLNDAQGRLWSLNQDGAWHVYVNGGWVMAVPPVSAPPPAPPHLAAPHFTVPPPANKKKRWVVLAAAGLAALACLALIAGGVILAATGQFATTGIQTTGISRTAINAVEIVPPGPPKPEEFAAQAGDLPRQIAELNRAELKFIEDAQKIQSQIGSGQGDHLTADGLSSASPLELDLRELSARAMKVGISARRLQSALDWSGDETAQKLGAQYHQVGQASFALVLLAQHLRERLAANGLNLGEAITAVGRHGALMWDQSVTTGPGGQAQRPENPFFAFMPGEVDNGLYRFLAPEDAQAMFQPDRGEPVSWMMTNPAATQVTIPVPDAARLAKLYPPDLDRLEAFTDTAAQADGTLATAAALALLDMGSDILEKSLASLTEDQVKMLMPIVTTKAPTGDQIMTGLMLLTPESSQAAILQKQESGNRMLINGVYTPKPGGHSLDPNDSFTVAAFKSAPVALKITDIELLGSNKAEDDEHFHNYFVRYSVSWETEMNPASFALKCTGVDGIDVTAPSGSRSFGSVTISTEGMDTSAEIYCGATTGNSTGGFTRWGSVVVMVEIPERVDARQTWEARQNQEAEVTETPTVTLTPAPTLTPTPTPSEMPTARATQTPIPPSPTATKPTVVALKGTFSINWQTGYYTTGFINLTVDLTTGSVSGDINGAGTYSGIDQSCPADDQKQYTNHREFSGTLQGTVNPETGDLVLQANSETGLGGTISTSGGCSEPMTVNLPPALALTGRLDLQAFIAKGVITSTHDYDAGTGDWHTGQ